ncbi:hypothetical protein [Robertkochia aurantiaca]|uniref:hypothetical protein n=1 Tax=Robertkochia aurantiaca TaxID=2873700 RepID=UPI001CCE53F8|nr:hypothetical protein [Robertkochia sp. 3YJGBD-33]
MKEIRIFIGKILVLALLLAGTYILFSWVLTRGFVGDDYPKFTHRAPNLILGLSRAHYGIDPQTLAASLDVPYQKEFLNFAFEKSQSPYGEVYLNAIKKKIPDSTTTGIYILGVSPGSFSAPDRMSSDAEVFEFDQKMMIAKVENLNAHPNFEYVRECFGRSLYKGILPHEHRITTVFHDNGWEEFRLSAGDYQIDQDQIRFWQQETVEGYTKLVKVLPESISDYRLRWFEKTIKTLQGHGEVFIVRIPMHPDLLKLEEQIWPEMDSLMTGFAKRNEVLYLNYADAVEERFQTYDASHLYSESAKAFTRQLARDISDYLNSKKKPILTEVREYSGR